MSSPVRALADRVFAWSVNVSRYVHADTSLTLYAWNRERAAAA